MKWWIIALIACYICAGLAGWFWADWDVKHHYLRRKDRDETPV